MEEFAPRIIENREFVELEEEDIRRLNQSEAGKFDLNPKMNQVMTQIEEELGNSGKWEEHWFTLNASGSRVYARIYYAADQAAAVTSDGRIVRKLNYPQQDDRKLH